MHNKTLVIILLIAVILLVIGGLYYWWSHRYGDPVPPGTETRTAYFAGGCFWCTESDFEKVPGVLKVTSGYTGGQLEDPTYEEVSKQTTGHREAVEVVYDPKQISYRKLVDYFFSHIDPTDPGGSFSDRGESYTSAIFYQTSEEKDAIYLHHANLVQAGAFRTQIATKILPFKKFWPAEEYHQDYYKKNPVRYLYYRNASGRDSRIAEICDYRLTRNIPCLEEIIEGE